MSYELFANKGARRLTAPAMSITKTGRINMNKALTALLRAAKAEYVLLFWDREKRKIGIKPTKKDSRAYQVGFTERDNSAGFHGASFAKHIGFDNAENRMMFVEHNERDGMFEAEVPEEFLLESGSERNDRKKKR